MKKLIKALALFSAVLLLAACQPEPKPASWYMIDGQEVFGYYSAGSFFRLEARVGDPGPAGGYIFYVNPNAAADGWTYLESAPATQGKGTFGYYVTTDQETGTASDNVIGTAREIGSGKTNTAAILAVKDNLMNASCGSAPVGSKQSALLCDSYSVRNNGKTYDDWFLPSVDEFAEFYANITEAGIDRTVIPLGSSSALTSYATSTENPSSPRDNILAFGAKNTGSAPVSKGKNLQLTVLPVRQF